MNILDGIRVSLDDKYATNAICEYISCFMEKECIVLCIGTDKYIGDCLGPLTGSLLLKKDFNTKVFGTLKNPVHAMNIKSVATEIQKNYKDHSIIAIDACLGIKEYIGSIQVKPGAIHPGKGVGKKLPPVGDLSIVGIVETSENSSILPLYNIRLGLIMEMAEVISDALCLTFSNR